MAEAWIVSLPVIAQDLAPESEFHKVIRITTEDEKELLYVQCTSNTSGETRIEFLVCGNLEGMEIEHVKDLIARVKNRGEVERLTPRKVGFSSR